MEKLIRTIVEALVDCEVKIDKDEKDGRTIFTILVPKEKIGLVIGRNGKVIKAIRTLVGIKTLNEKLTSYWRLEVASLENS